jgi:hypothetical protein
MKTDTKTLISALRILAKEIISEDGVANAAITEAADRLEEFLEEKSKGMKIWATKIKGRRPEFKTYTKKAHAMSALKYRSEYKDKGIYEVPEECKLLKLIDGKFVELEIKRSYSGLEQIKILNEP